MHCELEYEERVDNPDYAEIRAHLSAMLGSRSFSSSKRLCHFLTFVTEKALTGEADGLKEYVIATEVYGRGDDYDPQIDSTVRVEASRLRAKLREYYAGEGVAAPVRIDLPKGSYVPAFRFAVTPAPKPEPSIPPQVPQVPQNSRYLRPHLAASTILVTSVCIAIAAWVVQSTRNAPAVAAKASATAWSPKDPAVLAQYLRADQLLRQRVFLNGWSGEVPRNVIESIGLFEDVTNKAPLFAKGWAGLAEAQEWAYELDKQHPRARLDAARAAAERAVAVDPNLADAHARLSALYLYSYGDVERAERETVRAITLNPRDARAQARYVDILRMQGRLQDAYAAVNRALAVDASSPRLWSQQALVLYDLDRLPEAMDAADHALELNGGNQMNQMALAHWIRGLCLQQQGMLEAAEAEFRKGLAVAPQDDKNQPALGFVLARQGRTAQAMDVLAALKDQHERGKPVTYGIALVHAGLGNAEEASRWLAKSSASGETMYKLRSLDKRLRSMRTS